MKLTGIVLALSLAACGSTSTPGETPQPTAAAPEAPEATTAPAPSASVIETRSFSSQALGVDKSYVVYLPKGYASSPNRNYPVLYMLHGLGGSETNWRDMDIGKYADEVGFDGIIVMPDGDDGFYVNWANPADYDACLASKRQFGKAKDMKTYCVKQGRYEDYIASDLIRHIESTLRVIPKREARAIGGLSMGGFGALYLAMRRPGLYGAVASHAGWAALMYKGPKEYAKGKTELVTDPAPWLEEAGTFGPWLTQVFGVTRENWTAHDPATLAKGLAPGQLAIYMDCGSQDEFRFQNHNQYLAEVLTDAGVPHQFHLIEGGRHDRAFWTSRVDDSLRFIDRFFGGKQPHSDL